MSEKDKSTTVDQSGAVDNSAIVKQFFDGDVLKVTGDAALDVMTGLQIMNPHARVGNVIVNAAIADHDPLNPAETMRKIDQAFRP